MPTLIGPQANLATQAAQPFRPFPNATSRYYGIQAFGHFHRRHEGDLEKHNCTRAGPCLP